jgi:hypothetical protein
MKTQLNNRAKTGFNFKVSSYSVQSAVSIVITTITHIPKRTSILVDNLRECTRSSRKKPNLCSRPHAIEGGPMLIHMCHAVTMPCCAVALRSSFQSGMVGARQGRGVCVN